MSTNRNPTKAQAREAAKDAAIARGDHDLLGDEFVNDMRRIDGLGPRIDFNDKPAVALHLRAILGETHDGAALERAIDQNLQSIYGGQR